MISVTDALANLFALATPLESEEVPLIRANGRVLARDVIAQRHQPPFAASAMDGYAVSAATITGGKTYNVVGEAAAGHAWSGSLGHDEALRIFTGAPLPEGADHVIIQENVTRQGDTITVDDSANDISHVRPAGADFKSGDKVKAPKILCPSDIALFAAMNISTIHVTRRPVVAIIATGDELVQPGEMPRNDQIIASNSYGLAALIENYGAQARLLPIARDTATSLAYSFDLAADADLIITIGGASVGDHDLVASIAQSKGMAQSFYKVAMRPGKPLMAGRMGKAAMIGLPGNPVSAMVCGQVFVVPVIHKMLGLPAQPALRQTARLSHGVARNGPREHYMRAQITAKGVRIFERQDSALLTVLADANCLALRPPHDCAKHAGDEIDVIML